MKIINKIGSVVLTGCVLLMAGSCAEEKMVLESSSKISATLVDFSHTSNNYNFVVNLSVESKNDKIEIEGNKVQYVFTDDSGKEIVTETVLLDGNSEIVAGQVSYSAKCLLSEYNFNHDSAKLTIKARVRAVMDDGYESEWYDYVSEAIVLTGLRPFANLGLSVQWSTDDLVDSNGEALSTWATTNNMDGVPSDISATQWDPALYDKGEYVGVRRTPTLNEYLEMLDAKNCDYVVVKNDGTDDAYAMFTSRTTGQSIRFKISVASGAKTQFWTSTFDTANRMPIAIEFEAKGSHVDISTVACDPSTKLYRHTVLNSSN